MARSDFNIGPLINVMEALRQQLERQLDYQMQQQEKVKAEPRILRDEDERVQRILAGANAVQATQTEWGRASRRGQRQEAAGQLNLAEPANLPPDTEQRAQPQDPPGPTPNLNMPPPQRGTGFVQELHRARPSSFTQSREPRSFEEDLEQARSELPPLSTIQRFRREYGQAEGGRAARLRQALGSLNEEPDNLPPDSQGPDDGGNIGKSATPPPQPGGGGPGPGTGHFNPRDPLGFGNTNATTALTWAALGEHGGPRWMRNLYLGSWQFQQGLGWAGRNTENLRQALDDPNSTTSNVVGKIPGLSGALNNENLSAVTGAINLASDNPELAYLTYAGVKRGANFVSNRFAQLRDYQAMGQQFGYGGPSVGGQNVFGFHNPMGDFGAAAQTGAAFSAEQQALMGRIPGMGFGTGLSAQQAQGDVQSLAQQGFSMAPIGGGGAGGAILSGVSSIPVIGGPLAATGAGIAGAASHLPLIGGVIGSTFGTGLHGDAATIAQNLDRPLQTRFPGLTGEDINQFTPALRYSGTSVQQLTDSLSNLGIEAHSTRETVGQFASSLHEAAQGFQGLGSTMQGGVAVGTGFTNVTGMDPRVASQAAQNPLFQGMAMSHYGILPSGLGDMSSGAFTSNTLQTLQMLQRGLSGINHPTTQTINGVRLPVAQGQQQMYDQIAQMTGMDANQVRYMLRDQNQIQARATAQQAIGDSTSNSGLWGLVNQGQRNPNHKLNDRQYQMVNQDWQRAVVPYLKQSGVSAKEISRLNHMSGMRDRLTAAAGDISDRTNNDPLNQIQNRPNANTVQVEFTGQAAKFFQQVGGGSSPSPAKQSANAAWSGGNWNPGGGGPFGGYNKIANSTTGDLSSGASSSAWDYLNRSG